MPQGGIYAASWSGSSAHHVCSQPGGCGARCVACAGVPAEHDHEWCRLSQPQRHPAKGRINAWTAAGRQLPGCSKLRETRSEHRKHVSPRHKRVRVVLMSASDRTRRPPPARPGGTDCRSSSTFSARKRTAALAQKRLTRRGGAGRIMVANRTRRRIARQHKRRTRKRPARGNTWAPGQSAPGELCISASR